MRVCELDPDVVRWNLHLLDVCSLTSNATPETITCYARDMSITGSLTEGFCHSSNHNVVENDEAIAYTLQQEFSRLAEAETLGADSVPEEHQSESILYQDWHGPSGRLMNGFQGDQEEGGEYQRPFIQLDELSVEGTCQDFSPEIDDESDLDGEMGKRLNQMAPIPHVPKINGDIPSVDEATSDHERLLNRLQLYDLEELKISGDGNCQFRSLSDQIYRTQEHHKFVREQVVDQLKSQPDLYENYVPMEYREYLKRMSKSGEWGDHITLQAAADFYGFKIFVITSFKDTCYIEILPQFQKSNRTIFLSFWAEVHYNSIYPLGELPQIESRKKKWWWS